MNKYTSTCLNVDLADRAAALQGLHLDLPMVSSIPGPILAVASSLHSFGFIYRYLSRPR